MARAHDSAGARGARGAGVGSGGEPTHTSRVRLAIRSGTTGRPALQAAPPNRESELSQEVNESPLGLLNSCSVGG
jgi:hypothetical protein